MLNRKRGAQNVHFPQFRNSALAARCTQVDQNGEFQEYAGIANAAQHRGWHRSTPKTREKRASTPRGTQLLPFLHALAVAFPIKCEQLGGTRYQHCLVMMQATKNEAKITWPPAPAQAIGIARTFITGHYHRATGRNGSPKSPSPERKRVDQAGCRHRVLPDAPTMEVVRVLMARMKN